jgi:hypothetical protein
VSSIAILTELINPRFRDLHTDAFPQTPGSDQAQASQQLQSGQPDNQASFSHELIAGAAAYEADKAYENHCNANGGSMNFPHPESRYISIIMNTILVKLL